MVKVKVTLSLDRDIVKRAKAKASLSGISLSKIVEDFLNFYSNPYVYCFSCGVRFAVSEGEVCPSCGWLKCPSCGACRCNLGDEAAIVAYRLRKVYEDLLHGRLK